MVRTIRTGMLTKNHAYPRGVLIGGDIERGGSGRSGLSGLSRRRSRHAPVGVELRAERQAVRPELLLGAGPGAAARRCARHLNIPPTFKYTIHII